MDSPALWQVRVGEQIYQAELSEIIEWIGEGAVLPKHKIRRGNLRWLPAIKVPELNQYFYPAEEQLEGAASSGASVGAANGDLGHTTAPDTAPAEATAYNTTDAETAVVGETLTLRRFCATHRDALAEFVCGTCGLSLCKTCPNKFGSDVMICPSCGAMCITFSEAQDEIQTRGALNRPYARVSTGLDERKFFDTRIRGTDFWNALVLPFRSPGQLAFTGISLTLLAVGILTAVLGSPYNLATAIVCIYFAAAMVQCIATRVCSAFENNDDCAGFLPQLGAGFWSAALKPAALGSVVLTVSFALFALLAAGSIGYAWNHGLFAETSANAATLRSNLALAPANAGPVGAAGRRLENEIRQSRQELISSLMGKDYEVQDSETIKAMLTLMRLSVFFLAPLGITFMFGFLLFPAACGNAIEYGTLRGAASPLEMLRTLKRYGFDHIKIVSVLILSISTISFIAWAGFDIISKLVSPLSGTIFAALVVGLLGACTCVTASHLLAITIYRELELD